MEGVLRYNYEADCGTNGRCTAGFAFLDSLESIMCKWTRPFWGDRIAGSHPKAFPRPRQPLSAVLALRELESACS